MFRRRLKIEDQLNHSDNEFQNDFSRKRRQIHIVMTSQSVYRVHMNYVLQNKKTNSGDRSLLIIFICKTQNTNFFSGEVMSKKNFKVQKVCRKSAYCFCFCLFVCFLFIGILFHNMHVCKIINVHVLKGPYIAKGRKNLFLIYLAKKMV